MISEDEAEEDRHKNIFSVDDLSSPIDPSASKDLSLDENRTESERRSETESDRSITEVLKEAGKSQIGNFTIIINITML